MMKFFLAASLLLHRSLALVIVGPNNDNASTPEESSNRLLPRARTNPMACGTFTLKCKGAEGACNNACYHIKCIDPVSRTKVYVGSGQAATANRNRLDSGNTAASNSVCRSFPFSQLLIEDQVGSLNALYQSDEWPMATHQQTPFATRPANQRNSLRCILGTHNGNAGNQFKWFENDQKQAGSPGPIVGRNPACVGKLIAGDSFAVDFDLIGANQAELNHCIDLNATPPRMNQNCEDPKQFRLTARPNVAGKMSSPYDPFPLPNAAGNGFVAGSGNDNRYAIQYRNPRPELMQCSVEFIRSQHFQVEARVVNWANVDITPKLRANYPSGPFAATIPGLPYDLLVTATGGIGTPLQFVYGRHTGQQTAGDKIAHYRWNSNSKGQGKGPDGQDAFRICKIQLFNDKQYDARDLTYSIGLKGEAPPVANPALPKMQTELTKCFFPCFQHVL